MKTAMLSKIFFACMFFFPLLSTAQPEATCSKLDGVWEYDLPDRRGVWFSQNDRYLVLTVPKERKTFSQENPTPQEMADAFGELSASTGTLKCDGDRMTIIQEYGTFPGQAGPLGQWDLEIENGKCKYRAVLADGSHGPEGNTHKIADFADPKEVHCETSDGFWLYDLPDQYGISALAGGYFGWVLVDKAFWDAQTDLSTTESKTTAFGKFIAAAGSYTCDDEGMVHWKSLYAKDYRAEKGSFATKNAYEQDMLEYWFLNAEGQRTGGGKAKRLK